MSRETEKRQLRAGNFMMNNGRVLSTINLLREKYNALRSVEKAVSYEGIEKQEFVDSVNFLAEEGYIHLRDIKSHDARAELPAGQVPASSTPTLRCGSACWKTMPWPMVWSRASWTRAL